jgi:2',3'-cyclic-nucleotide 2'-phosphodiesterase (5'-nucleotidase family)
VRLTILHTNDVHGRVEGLARVATLVERIRRETPHRVLYMDAGDVEETTNRLSNITKGAAMHRLLSAAGCEVATVGNAAWLRYGPQVIAEHARVARYPLLLANLRPVEGARDSVLLDGVGVIGVTASFADYYGDSISFGVEAVREAPLVRRLARDLRRRGAELVVLLSHLGYEAPDDPVDDLRLAAELQGEIDLVISAHTHHLLPEGDRVGDVVVASAGEYAQHLGRIEVDDDRIDAHVIPVGDDVPPHPAVLAEAARIEPEVEAYLGETIGAVDGPLDADWIASMLRERMGAEVGLAVAGQVLSGPPLPPGEVKRGELWDVCDSSANPGVATLDGARLLQLLERAQRPEWIDERRRPLRGRTHGRLCVSGLDPASIRPGREYVVAGTDYELEAYGGLVDSEWNLSIRYDFPTIVREAIEEHLRR